MAGEEHGCCCCWLLQCPNNQNRNKVVCTFECNQHSFNFISCSISKNHHHYRHRHRSCWVSFPQKMAVDVRARENSRYLFVLNSHIRQMQTRTHTYTQTQLIVVMMFTQYIIATQKHTHACTHATHACIIIVVVVVTIDDGKLALNWWNVKQPTHRHPPNPEMLMLVGQHWYFRRRHHREQQQRE